MAQRPPKEEAEERSDQPPASLWVEKLVLGAALQNAKHLADVIDGVEPSDFTLPAHQKIFDRIAGLSRLGIAKIDTVLLSESLLANGDLQAVGGITYLVNLDEGQPSVTNLTEYIRILKEKTRLRKLLYLGNDIISKVQLGAANSAEIITALDRQIYTSFNLASKPTLQKLSDFMLEAGPGTLLNPKANGDGIKTGYRKLDELTDGIHDTEIMLFGGATSVGKSSITIQVAMHNARKGMPIAIYSLEMSRKALFTRMVCQMAIVPVMRFKAGDLNQSERLRVIECSGELNELPIYIDDSPTLRPSDLMLRNRRAKEQSGIKLSILDYVQMMRPDASKGNSVEKLTEICDAMKIIAKETTPIVVLSQLSQEHRKMKERPSVNDFKGGGMIGEMAQVAVQIFRPEMERGGKKDPLTRGKAEFILVKNRDGEIKDIPMRYIGWRMMFEDSEEQGYLSNDDGNN